MPSYQVKRVYKHANYSGGEFAETLEVGGEIHPENRETFNLHWLKKAMRYLNGLRNIKLNSAFNRSIEPGDKVESEIEVLRNKVT